MVDPRVSPPLSSNELLLDRAVRHAIHLERYKAGEVRRIQQFLDTKLYPDLLGRLTTRLERIKLRGFDRGPATTKKVQDMLAALDAIVDRGVGEASRMHRQGLFQFANVESAWQAAAMESAIPPAVFEVVLPSPATLRSVVTSRPFQGKFLRQWWSQHNRATKGRVRDAILAGLVEGQGTSAIVRRVRDVLPITRRGAEFVVRTAASHVSNHARQATYAANSDVVKGWQFIATLDSRTTPICQSLDGSTHPVDRGPMPPRHGGCRSSSVPILKSFRELGFDLDEIPEGTRASMNGQVPASLTYPQWLKKQPRDVQEDALGVARAKLFREGKLTVDKFVDRTGRTLTLDELAARNPKAGVPV